VCLVVVHNLLICLLLSTRVRLSVKIRDEYRHCKELPPALVAQQGPVGPAQPRETRKMITAGRKYVSVCKNTSHDLVAAAADSNASRMIATMDKPPPQPSSFTSNTKLSQALMLHKTTRVVKPTYHPPWKLMRVISGHLGWVRSVAVEPGNQWFATGAGDRVIKIWDLASGELKLSLTGHISTVRGLAVSPRHPYLFSCGEDKVRQ
jgi:pleiotropic regulator 1